MFDGILLLVVDIVLLIGVGVYVLSIYNERDYVKEWANKLF